MKIFVIRHGETASNYERIVQTPDTPLNERGVLQAERLGRRLADTGIEVVLTSDLARARQTAERVDAILPLEEEPLLQERNFGDLRGRTYASIGLDIFALGYAPPGGESWEVFHQRVDAAWERVVSRAARCEGALAVVTHGLVLRSLAARILSLPAGIEAPERWGNTSLTIVGGAAPWPVEVLNCTAHLEGVASDRTIESGM